MLPIWTRLSRAGIIDDGKAKALTMELVDRLRVVATGPTESIDDLSGGNQQKAVVGKALSADPEILLMDEPTAGIDVLAKRQILEEVRRIAAEGNAVILISSDLAELAAACHRILILHRGLVAAELDRTRGDVITEAALLHAIQPTETALTVADEELHSNLNA
jgi:ribose transport system ATP-binding protein